jgi:large conductance mechanosensitive channel
MVMQNAGTVLNEFKAFILRGNVVDLAVGIVIGAAFGAVVNALVKDIITPILTIPGKTNFADLTFTIGGGVFLYGDFINAAISFISIAAAVFFFVVKPVNMLMARRKTETAVLPTTRECPFCLSSVPLAATRCAFCTSEISATTAA